MVCNNSWATRTSSVRSPPGSGVSEPARVLGLTRVQAVGTMRAWLVEPERTTVREERPDDVDDALRGLGYVPAADVSRPNDGR